MEVTSNLSLALSSGVMTTTEVIKTEEASSEMNTRTVALINHIAYNYVALFIVGLGIIGNILNLIVLTRPKLKGVMYVYLLGLAVSNLCVLIIAIPALNYLTAPECSSNYAKEYFHAHLMIPLLNSFMAWSVYIIICMTVNRYISIYMPTYFQRIHTFKNAYVAIFFSFLGGVLLHVPLSFEGVVVTCADDKVGPVSSVTPSSSPLGDSFTDLSYKASTNKDIAEHPLYNVYLWVSETLLRLGPIVTLTILNILIIVRFNRIAKKREHLKGPAVNRTPTTHKNGKTNSLKRSASPAALSAALTNGPSPIQAPLQQRSVSPIACVIDQVNNGTASINGNLLTVPTNGAPPAIISLDHANSTLDVQVETDQKTTTTALTVVEGGVPPSMLTTPAKNERSGSVTSARLLATRSTPNRASTRRRGLHNPEERMLVVVLIAIVVLFVICTTPAAFLTLSISVERKKLVGFSIFRACANNLELLGFALNFFVYCLCSADIRAAFVDVLFDNWLVAWMRSKLAKSSPSLDASQEQHELQVVEKRSAVVASIHNHKMLNTAANV